MTTSPLEIESALPLTQDAMRQERIASIDIFRGLTVLVMILVDNLGFVKGLPWWTYHMPREANGMTYVDMVFPAFLFLMGMSIPISIRARSAQGQSSPRIWLHIALRSLALIVMGLFVANAPQVDPTHAKISAAWWTNLGFVAIALIWVEYPFSSRRKRIRDVFRWCGIALLAALALLFRRVTADGHVAWLDFSDWEILGLLGWAYLAASTLYLLVREKFVALFVALAALVTINALSTADRLPWLASLPRYLKPFEAGLTSITVAGLITSLLLIGTPAARSLKAKFWYAAAFATILFAAGRALAPLEISKIRDTPTWCLYCSAANVLIAFSLSWLVDVKHHSRWAAFTRPVGSNALLAYFLPYVAYLNATLSSLTADSPSGWYGVLRSLLFVALIWIAIAVLTRARIRMRL